MTRRGRSAAGAASGCQPTASAASSTASSQSGIPNAVELAYRIEGFLAKSNREDMRLILDAVNRGIMGAIERQRSYASRCDGAMMAALALASKSRLSPELTRTLSMRVGANLLPDDGRSALEKEFVASAMSAFGQDAQRLEAKPASATPERGDAQ